MGSKTIKFFFVVLFVILLGAAGLEGLSMASLPGGAVLAPVRAGNTVVTE